MEEHPLVRAEEEKDWPRVHSLNLAAFGRLDEADLVDALRQQALPCVSLVAEQRGFIVGHVMFTPVFLSGHPDLQIMGLAPVAVSPLHQRGGIGSMLIRAGLERCKELGFGAVVVLGDPHYYARFGFLPAAPLGLRCQFEAPADAFRVLELEPNYLRNASGMITYLPPFTRFC